MALINNNTKWVLFLSAKGQAEERHILDLSFGLFCLEAAKIDVKDISIYIDGPDRPLISQLISTGSTKVYPIKESKDFFTDLASNDHENMILFVTGHGGLEGIDAPTPITPFGLLRSIKGTKNLKQAIVYLGQCHAGIFNYIGAGKRHSPDGNVEPDIIIIGATNLHNSLSSSTTENLVTGPVSWLANLFLLHIFKWLSKPIDVDGDGKNTVIDSYKYAGAMSNQANKEIKIGSFVNSIELHDKWNTAKQAYQTAPSPVTLLPYNALTTQYEAELSIRYTHQECWILNAIPAQFVEF